MTLSPTVAEWAETYEQECGHKPTDLALRIAEHILKVGKMLNAVGREDAIAGRGLRKADVFPALVYKAFSLRWDECPETVRDIADIWQNDYMEGYEDFQA